MEAKQQQIQNVNVIKFLPKKSPKFAATDNLEDSCRSYVGITLNSESCTNSKAKYYHQYATM